MSNSAWKVHPMPKVELSALVHRVTGEHLPDESDTTEPATTNVIDFSTGSKVRIPVSSNSRMAEMAREMPRKPWDHFLAELEWKQGQHFGLIGPTGSGKTVMSLNLLPLHPYVVAMATKPVDETMDALVNQEGYVKYERWPNGLSARQFPRRIIWPNARRIDAKHVQKEVFHDAFGRIYIDGGWTVFVDELWVMDNTLKLEDDIKTFLLQARSLHISLLAGTQRPAWVPRELYTSCTHLMFWRNNDETDLRSISGIGYLSGDLIRYAVARLEPFECLYINTRTGEMCRTKPPAIN